MKNYVILLLMICCSVQLFSQEKWEKNKMAVMNFLKEEGFSPSSESETRIKFKKEGVTYQIIFDKSDEMFYVLRGYSATFEPDERIRVLNAANTVNENTKVVKVYCSDDTVYADLEVFCKEPTQFFTIFYKLLNIATNVKSRFADAYLNN